MAHVRDILEKKAKKEIMTIGPSASVMEAARIMSEKHVGALVVLKDDQVIGMVSERDIVNRIVVPRRSIDDTHVGEVMSSPVAFVTRETEIDECRAIMTQKKIRHLPVVEENQLVGVVSIGDLTAWEIDDQKTTIDYLKEYIYGRS